MRFWQALVTAEMAAGAVWADRYHDILWLHIAADAGNVLLGALLWRLFKAMAETSAARPREGGE